MCVPPPAGGGVSRRPGEDCLIGLHFVLLWRGQRSGSSRLEAMQSLDPLGSAWKAWTWKARIQSLKGIFEWRPQGTPNMAANAPHATPGASKCLVRAATPHDMGEVTAIYANFVETSTATFELVSPDEAGTLRRRQAVGVFRKVGGRASDCSFDFSLRCHPLPLSRSRSSTGSRATQSRKADPLPRYHRRQSPGRRPRNGHRYRRVHTPQYTKTASTS